MRFPDSLKAVARAGVGVNTIPLDQLANRGIPVFSTPGANANAVKELVIGSLFLTARKLVPSLLWTNNLRGPDIPERIEANKKTIRRNGVTRETNRDRWTWGDRGKLSQHPSRARHDRHRL